MVTYSQCRRFLWIGIFAGLLASAPPVLAQSGNVGARTGNGTLLTAEGLLVIQALARLLEGNGDAGALGPVRFRSPDVAPDPDPAIQGESFYFGMVQLRRHGVVIGTPEARIMEGLMVHREPLGRYATTGFRARYELQSDGLLTVDWGATWPIYALEPPVYISVVPADALPSDWPSSVTTMADVIGLARDFGYKSDKPWAIPKGAQDNLAIAVFLDRIAPSDKVGLKLGKNPTDTQGDGGSTIILEQGSWKAAMLRGRFELNGGPERYLNAVLSAPSATDGSVNSRVVATLSTNLESPKKPLTGPAQ